MGSLFWVSEPCANNVERMKGSPIAGDQTMARDERDLALSWECLRKNRGRGSRDYFVSRY